MNMQFTQSRCCQGGCGAITDSREPTRSTAVEASACAGSPCVALSSGVALFACSVIKRMGLARFFLFSTGMMFSFTSKALERRFSFRAQRDSLTAGEDIFFSCFLCTGRCLPTGCSFLQHLFVTLLSAISLLRP